MSEDDLIDYSLAEHIHNFACWTAARASQRGFRTSADIIHAIGKSRLAEILTIKESRPKNVSDFDLWHEKTATLLLSDLGAATTDYGRAAKIIAIYLKTAVLLPEGNNDFSRIMHPPIDRILIKNLSNEMRRQSDLISAHYFDSIAWTKLNAAAYKTLIAALRSKNLDQPAFWHLERFWAVGDNEAEP